MAKTPLRGAARKAYDRRKYLERNPRKKPIYKSSQSQSNRKETKREYAAAHAENNRRDKAEAILEAERQKCRTDLYYLWEKAFRVKFPHPITREMVWQEWGHIHRIAADFIHIDCGTEVVRYSELQQYIPERVNGIYKERWLYWPVLDKPPQIYDGPPGENNPISQMFYNKTCSFWHGVVIRFKGDARTTELLMPRGWLKTTICGVAESLRRIVSEPDGRFVIRSVVDETAVRFMGHVKYPFKYRPQFERLFAHMIPTDRNVPWRDDAIQLIDKNKPKRGIDPTLQASGITSDRAGSHADGYLLDDVVGESNTKSPVLLQKTKTNYDQLQAQRDAHAYLHVNGTRWDDDDSNGEMLRPESSACFMCVTALDADRTVKVPTRLTPLGYGKPIWNEWLTLRWLEAKREEMNSDHFYFCQMFNQITGTSSRLFNRAWIRNLCEEQPITIVRGKRTQTKHMSLPELADALELNIFMGVDTASGKPNQAGKLDRTAAVVLGQTKDCSAVYVLDGFCEKLPAELIAQGIVELALKWRDIAAGYGGIFNAGFEQTPFTNFLEVTLEFEQRKRGVSSVFSIEPMATKNWAKVDRAYPLAQAFREGLIFVPEKMPVTSLVDGSQYDFREVFEGEFVTFNPKSTADDTIDALVYAWKLTQPTEWRQAYGPKPAHPSQLPGVYSREQVAVVPDDIPELWQRG